MKLILLAVLISGCSVKDIVPDVHVYKEIPFVDCPEAVSVSTVTRKEQVLTCEQWKKKRPYVVAIDPEGWEKIKLSWLKACRYGKEKECNVALESVDKLITDLDNITRTLVPKP